MTVLIYFIIVDLQKSTEVQIKFKDINADWATL